MKDDTGVTIPPLNDEHRLNIGISLGLSAALNYLDQADDTLRRQPGFNSARALIESVEARHRANVAGANMRAAIAAGYDLATHMIGMKGRGVIYVQPMDLEELAEFAPATVAPPSQPPPNQGDA